MKGKETLPEEDAPVSKSQRRRDALELKSLALELMKISPARLARIPLDDDVRDAIMDARQISAHVARKRQMQYAAKLLRRIDPEPIFQAIEGFDTEARALTGRQHRAEAWRDFLLESGDPAVGKLMQQRNHADSQAIRQLIRNAVREASHSKPPSSARSLFRLLREMDEADPLPPITES